MSIMPKKKRELLDMVWKNYRKRTKMHSDLQDFKYAPKEEQCTSKDGCVQEPSETPSSCPNHVCSHTKTALKLLNDISGSVYDHNYALRGTTLTTPDGNQGFPDNKVKPISSKQIEDTTAKNRPDYTKSLLKQQTPRKNKRSDARSQTTLKNSEKSNAEMKNHHTKPDKNQLYAETWVTPNIKLGRSDSRTDSQISYSISENGNGDSESPKTHTLPKNGYDRTDILTACIFTNEGCDASKMDVNRTFEIKVPIFNSIAVIAREETLENLAEKVRHKLQPPYFVSFQEDVIEIIEHYKIKGKTSVKLVINIDRMFQAKIFVHRKEVSHDHHFWTGLPTNYDSYSNISQLLTQLENFRVCIGNPEKRFYELPSIPWELNDSQHPSRLQGYKEGDFCSQVGNLDYHSTIRTNKCALLVSGHRCNTCNLYRRQLGKRMHRFNKRNKSIETASFEDLTHRKYTQKDMTKEMLILKIKQQRNRIYSLQRENDRLHRKIEEVPSSS